jgi:signal transduction histidine kinase
MIQLLLVNARERFQQSHAGGPIEIGRGPMRDAIPRVTLTDVHVSRDQLRIEEVSGRKIKVENLSQRVAATVNNIQVEPLGSLVISLPARIVIGETVVSADDRVEELIRENDLKTLGGLPRGKARTNPTFFELGEAPESEALVNWLESVLTIQRAATGSREFYEQTAKVLVDRLGLDTGMVILREADGWRSIAQCARNEKRLECSYSTTILRKVLTEKRTFFLPSSATNSMASLAGDAQSVIASPILDIADEVVGVVYGSRLYSPRSRDIGPLEAQVVQLLASAVGTGLARLVQDAETQRLRLAKEAAEGADRTKSLFLAMISHELRTPLTTILGYCDMLHQETKRDAQLKYHPDLKRITDAANHLLKLINELLDLSKIEAGKFDLTKEQFDFSSLIHDIFHSTQPLAQTNQNRLELECPDDLGLGIGDPIRIRQCVLNLISNACKFTKAGSVFVSAQKYHDEGRDWFMIDVTDSGIGMNEEQISRLFQPFTQVDSSAGRRYGGTGLGLAITQKICTAMGGTLSVVSQPDRGSTFTMVFPTEIA